MTVNKYLFNICVMSEEVVPFLYLLQAEGMKLERLI